MMNKYKRLINIMAILVMIIILPLVVGCSRTQDTESPIEEPTKETIDEIGEEVYTNTELEGNLFLTIETNGQISDIKINEIDTDKFSEVEFDISRYIKEHEEISYTSVEGVTIDEGSALIVSVYELETIPMYYIIFRDELDKVGCYLVAYGFDGDGNEIIVEEVKINQH